MLLREHRQALRLQRCQNRRLGYGLYTRAKSFWGKFCVKNGEIKLRCLEKSWHCRVTRF